MPSGPLAAFEAGLTPASLAKDLALLMGDSLLTVATARTALWRLSSEIQGLSLFTAFARRFVSTTSFRDSRSASRVSAATNV
jgi:hypothetical protein